MEFEEAAKKHNLEYIERTDWRVKKPLVIFHEKNPEKKLVLSNNWVLESDNLETMLDKPNDVAIYSNISMSNLEKAKDFHQNEIKTRKKNRFPTKALQQEDLKKYYDYFEIIITSVVFAYTAIEAFANICIPSNYIYSCLDKKGNTRNMNKEEIERYCSLTEKLKSILPEILNCDKLTTKPLVWQKFIELEKLRDEIIHSKESKAENRYSSLLSSSLFQIIENHKEVIKFFGEAIHTKKSELLDEYPNGFGFDSYRVNKVSDEKFKKSSEIF